MILGSCGGSSATQPGKTTDGLVTTTPPSQLQTTTATPTPATTVLPKPAGLETESYNNDTYLFSIDVPKGWTLRQETTGLYILFTWSTEKGFPGLSVTIRQFMQPILIDTFVTKFETEVYGSSYKETKKEALTYQDIAVEYTMTTTDVGGAAVDVIGGTVYHQHGNDFYVVTDTVKKSGDEAILAAFKYCASTYKSTRKMG